MVKNLTREDSRRPCSYQLNFVIWGPFCFLAAILFFKILCIRTSMQNLDSVAQEMSELCSILRFDGHFVFWQAYCFSFFFQNLYVAQEMSQLCSIF